MLQNPKPKKVLSEQHLVCCKELWISIYLIGGTDKDKLNEEEKIKMFLDMFLDPWGKDYNQAITLLSQTQTLSEIATFMQMKDNALSKEQNI